VVGPWTAYNLHRFEEPTTVSTSLGLAARSSNCHEVYYGRYLGYSSVFPPCTRARLGIEQSVWDSQLRQDAVDYVSDHAGRLPVVAAARVGRVWNLYELGQTMDLAELEGRPIWAGWLGAVSTWVLAPLAVAGGLVLRRQGRSIWPLMAPLTATAPRSSPCWWSWLR
jgi:hypothetical protein